ncbi:hypothetical protein [Moorena producens]|uniref:hypothetical protein n=1 Tax=Moorena producens TaxID=1155739 RepID=UPI0011EA6BFD|nr:hypothetical protein [Moorena producens]
MQRGSSSRQGLSNVKFLKTVKKIISECLIAKAMQRGLGEPVPSRGGIPRRRNLFIVEPL